MTTLMPRARSTGTFLATESGVEKSIATSTPRQRSASGPSWPDGDSGSITPATVDPYSPARLSTIRPILPYPTSSSCIYLVQHRAYHEGTKDTKSFFL